MVSNIRSRREILVFTEGEGTEVQYLAYWHRRHREHILVTIDAFHGGPLQLVQHAVEQRKRDQRNERKGSGRAPLETWCMFDIDDHPKVPEALQLARAHGIRIAVSNPCLEVWYLLHFKDQTAWIGRRDAQSEVGGFITKSKILTPADLSELGRRFDDARQRSQRLAAMHEANGNPKGDNPSSNVWCLIDSISQGLQTAD